MRKAQGRDDFKKVFEIIPRILSRKEMGTLSEDERYQQRFSKRSLRIIEDKTSRMIQVSTGIGDQ
jgi:hypothetical protein